MKNLSKKTSIILWTIISVALAFGYTAVCDKLNVYNNSMYIIRTICTFGIIDFIGLHFIIGFKNLWDYIIDKRYVIALILLVLFSVLGVSGSSMGAITNWVLEPEADNTVLGTYRFIRSDEYAVDTLLSASQIKNGFNRLSNFIGTGNVDLFFTIYVPIKTILSLFRIYNIGYIIPNFNFAYSFAGNFKLIASLLITYEFFQVITDKKKYLSLAGTILVIGSSFVAWWFREAIEIIAYGELAIIALNQYMLVKDKKKKIAWISCLTYSIISYALILYPAWQISFGYVFLALAIWIIIKNRKDFKFEKIDIVGIICSALVIVAVAVYTAITSSEAIRVIMNTSYPGGRFETGGGGIKFLFEYLYSFMLPFIQNVDTMEFAGMMSFFPIPIILGIIYLYKTEKHIDFILPMLVVLVLESVWVMSGFPKIIAGCTLLYMVPVERCATAVALGSIYLIMYMFANVEEKFVKQAHSVYIVLGLLVLLFFIEVPTILNTRLNLNIFAMVEAWFGFLLFNIGESKYNKTFLSTVVILTLISSIFVNPITYGTAPITDTEFAKYVQSEVEKDADKIWLTEEMDMVVSNYLVAQGAKTINCTQTYPNEEFWKKILEDKTEEYREIWNRYAHIRVYIVEDGESYVELIANDRINLYLTTAKIRELNVNYIVSYKDLEEVWKNGISIKKIYAKKNTRDYINIEGQEVSGLYVYEIVN